MRITSSITPMYDGIYDIYLSNDNIRLKDCFPNNYDEVQMKKISIKVYDDDADEEGIFVAYMELHLMYVSDELIDLADAQNTDLGSAMTQLHLVSKHLDTEDEDYGTTYGYIHVLYIKPEYRQKGISSFLLNNLADILDIYHGIMNLSMVATCKHITDITVDEENDVVHVGYSDRMEAEDVEKLKIMGTNLTRNGFDLCTKSNNNWYYRRYDK